MFGGKRRGKRKMYKPKRYAKRWKKNSKRQVVQYFKRTDYIEKWQLVPNGANNYVYQFSLAQVPNATDFTNLYDAYQIKAVKLSIIPRSTEAEISTTAYSYQIHSVLDYDDGTPLTSLNDYVQFESYKTTNPFRQHNRYLVPAMEQGVLNTGGVIVPAVQKKRQWLDTQFATIPHNSVKIHIRNDLGVEVPFDLKVTYYLAMKQVN